LEVQIIIVHGPARDMTGPDFIAVSQDNIGYLADCCCKHGIVVALENTMGGVTASAEHLQAWLRTINRKNLAACLDVGHAHRAGLDPVVMVRALPDLAHIHVHGFHPDLGDHRPLQDGIVNWENLATVLRQRHYTGGIVIELKPETLGENPTETLQRDVDLLLQVSGL
jgi:sugar phosphate isomerase/epimerase